MRWSDSHWLSEFPGYTLRFSCRRCGLMKRYAGDAILAAAGDIKLGGLSGKIARALGCPRVDVVGLDACRFSFSEWQALIPAPPARSMAVPEPDMTDDAHRVTNVRFKDIAEWWVLHALCHTCKHEGFIDRYELARKYGDRVEVQRLVKLLRCTSCGSRRSAEFVVRKVKR